MGAVFSVLSGSLRHFTRSSRDHRAAEQIPSPQQYFGFQIGADRKLVRYDKIVEYLQKIAGMSDRVRVYTLGPTTNKNPLLLLEISSPRTQKNLDHYKTLERELYLQGGPPSDSQAR